MSELPNLPARPSRREMRKAIVRLRLELQRQQLQQEAQLLLQPLRQARDLGQSVRQHLHGFSPLWAAGGGAATLALLLGRKRRWMRLLRLGLILAPLLFKLRQQTTATTKAESDPPS